MRALKRQKYIYSPFTLLPEGHEVPMYPCPKYNSKSLDMFPELKINYKQLNRRLEGKTEVQVIPGDKKKTKEL